VLDENGDGVPVAVEWCGEIELLAVISVAVAAPSLLACPSICSVASVIWPVAKRLARH
jgi:hypothetical protein